MERRASFENGRPRSRGWKNFGRRWTRGVEGFGTWAIFMDVICASFFNMNNPLELKPLIRFRIGFSHLEEHKLNAIFKIL